jgi:hypothetical protein
LRANQMFHVERVERCAMFHMERHGHNKKKC